MNTFDAVIVGGGPGGATLANIFASRGIKVALIERQKDFSKEFRGEALMPSGKEVLDQIGVDLDAENIKYRKIDQLNIFYKGALIGNPDIKFIKEGQFRWASQPQLLEKIIEKTSDFKNFKFFRGFKAEDLIYENDRVSGVRIRNMDEDIFLSGKVVIGFDGRSSMVRKKLDFSIEKFHQPADVLWFKVPYPKKFIPGSQAFFSLFPMSMLVCIPVYDQKLQVGWVIPSGSYGELKQQGKEKWVEFIRKRNKSGALLLGDAAHTMNAVGGQGLNIALRDAIVCANHLVPLLKTDADTKDLDFAFEKIEKERLNEVRQVQEIQSRPPKFIFINKYLIDLIFPIIKIIFKFRIINRLADKEFDKISKGFDKVKLEV